MKKRKLFPETAKYTAIILLCVGGLGTMLSALIGNYVLLSLCLIPLLASVAMDLFFWRCPHCGSHLGRYWDKYCPSCGELADL